MKQSKKNKNNKKIVWAFFGLIVILLIFLTLLTGGFLRKEKSQIVQNISPTTQVESNSYHSEILKITIEIPNGVSVKEENVLRELILEKNGSRIKVHRFSTNRSYDSIKIFLDEVYNSGNQPMQVVRKSTKIDGKDCEISILKKYKKYYCYLDSNSFLSFYTESSELYSDLDQIARSFRYEP